MSRQQRWVIDQVGALFGFSKRCSDAAWEWWHITYCCATAATRERVNKILRRAKNSPVLKRGDHGKAVGAVQWHLRRRGFDVPKKGEKGHRDFGEKTERAVREFQRRHNMRADGVVGLRTWRALRR